MTMLALVGIFNVLLGCVYLSYAGLTLVELRRRGRVMLTLERHYAFAWILMALTCGPHHLMHGAFTAVHIIDSHSNVLADIGFLCHLGGSAGSHGLVLATSTNLAAADWIAVLIGFPMGLTWFVLQLGAATGRWRGDVHFRVWRGRTVLPMLVIAGGAYAGVLAALLISEPPRVPSPKLGLAVAANGLLAILYCTIGYVVMRTQIRRHARVGFWSLSGLSLAVVFVTCAAMHLVYGLLLSRGVYTIRQPMSGIDFLAVPVAAYFLSVVHAISRSPDFIED